MTKTTFYFIFSYHPICSNDQDKLFVNEIDRRVDDLSSLTNIKYFIHLN